MDLGQETAESARAMFDRFMFLRVHRRRLELYRSKVQLVAGACIYLASKVHGLPEV